MTSKKLAKPLLETTLPDEGQVSVNKKGATNTPAFASGEVFKGKLPDSGFIPAEQSRSDAARKIVAIVKAAAEKSVEGKVPVAINEEWLFQLAFDALKSNNDAEWIGQVASKWVASAFETNRIRLNRIKTLEEMMAPEVIIDNEHQVLASSTAKSVSDAGFLFSFMSKAGECGYDAKEFLKLQLKLYRHSSAFQIRRGLSMIKNMGAFIGKIERREFRTKRFDKELYSQIVEATRPFFISNGEKKATLGMQEAFQLMNTLAQVGPPEEALTGDIYDGTNEMSFLSPPEQLSENTRSLNFRLLEHGIFFEIIPAVDNARQVIPGQYLVGLFAIRWSATFDGTRVFCERAKPDSQAYFNNSEIRGYRSARYNSRLDDVFIHAGGKARMPAGEVASNAIHEIEHSIANILFPYLDPVSSEELAYLSEIANQGSPEKRERVFRDSFDTALITAIFGEDISSTSIHVKAKIRIYHGAMGDSEAVPALYDGFYKKHLGITHSCLLEIARSFDDADLKY